MKAIKIFINALALSALTLVACNKETKEPKTDTIQARIELSSTRTALDGPDADGIYKTVWKSWDAIGIYSGNKAAQKFTLISGADTNIGEFDGMTSYDDMAAIYPYSIAQRRNGSVITVNLPEVQEYVSGNIPVGAYPMAAASDNRTLTFKNLCSVLKIPMYGELTVKSITFTPNNADVKAAGTANVDIKSYELTMSSTAASSVKLDCNEGVKLTGKPTDFHLVVPAQVYNDGFTLAINTDKGAVVKSIKSDVTLSRSYLYPIAAFECKIDDSKDNIVFEDANFKAYLIANFDKNGDGEINHGEAREITDINVCSDNIESLAGIEYMTNLETLRCRGTFNNKTGETNGSLKTIDVSRNKKLKSLNVGYNVITTIDLTNNVELTELSCEDNHLSSLDISKNINLTRLICNRNNLKTVLITDNKDLRTFCASSNELSSVDVTNNEKLDTLALHGNSISVLDLSHSTSLTYFGCTSNKLISLDLSHNPLLEELMIGHNELVTIDVSRCTNLKIFNCSENLIENTIDVSNCTKLTIFQCWRNKINKIVMTPSTDLYNFYCGENEIESLDVSTNTGLKDFDCSRNKLKTLDVSHNTLLYALGCENNNIGSLDLSSNIKLQTLHCYENNLKGLDITHNPELHTLDCYDNEIVSLDISNNKALSWLHCQDNPLKTLYVFKGQYDAIKYKKIPDFTQIIESILPGGNNDTTTGDKIRLE